MPLPPAYIPWLAQLGCHDISLGYSGITLFADEEIDDAQIGYSRWAEGHSFCDGKPGSWKPEWVAIGRETALGDPIILDSASPDLRVMSAIHGEGSWNPVVISSSLVGFGEALLELKRASVGRGTPVTLEQNPISPDERESVLTRIRNAIGPEGDMELWSGMLEGEG